MNFDGDGSFPVVTDSFSERLTLTPKSAMQINILLTLVTLSILVDNRRDHEDVTGCCDASQAPLLMRRVEFLGFEWIRAFVH